MVGTSLAGCARGDQPQGQDGGFIVALVVLLLRANVTAKNSTHPGTVSNIFWFAFLIGVVALITIGACPHPVATPTGRVSGERRFGHDRLGALAGPLFALGFGARAPESLAARDASMSARVIGARRSPTLTADSLPVAIQLRIVCSLGVSTSAASATSATVRDVHVGNGSPMVAPSRREPLPAGDRGTFIRSRRRRAHHPTGKGRTHQKQHGPIVNRCGGFEGSSAVVTGR